MRKFAQILNDKVHYVFESENKPEVSNEIILIDITGKNKIKEGWNYNIYDKTFSEPEEVENNMIDPTESLSADMRIEMINLLIELEVI